MAEALEALTTLANKEAVLEKGNQVFDGNLISVECSAGPPKDGGLSCVNVKFSCDNKVLTEQLRQVEVDYQALLPVIKRVGVDDTLGSFPRFKYILPALELLSGETNDYEEILKLETWLLGYEDSFTTYDGGALMELNKLKTLVQDFGALNLIQCDDCDAITQAIDDFFKVGQKIHEEINKIKAHLLDDFVARPDVTLIIKTSLER